MHWGIHPSNLHTETAYKQNLDHSWEFANLLLPNPIQSHSAWDHGSSLSLWPQNCQKLTPSLLKVTCI